MIKIKIVSIGSLKENYLKEMLDEYLKRLKPYCKVEIYEEKEEKLLTVNDSLISKTLEKEGERLIKRIDSNDYVILVDLHGKEYDSISLAKHFDKLMSQGKSQIAFVIGGSYGLGNNIRNIANEGICLSKLTFTHQFTKIILLEQIYRSFKINNNEVYHK